MLITKIADNQLILYSWIEKNLKPIKRIEYSCSSIFLADIAKKHLGDWVTHEDFKQAMIRCGFWADTSFCNKNCTNWYFNVSVRSMGRIIR